MAITKPIWRTANLGMGITWGCRFSDIAKARDDMILRYGRARFGQTPSVYPYTQPIAPPYTQPIAPPYTQPIAPPYTQPTAPLPYVQPITSTNGSPGGSANTAIVPYDHGEGGSGGGGGGRPIDEMPGGEISDTPKKSSWPLGILIGILVYYLMNQKESEG